VNKQVHHKHKTPISTKTSIYKLASIISKRATKIRDVCFTKCSHMQLRTQFVQVSKQASEYAIKFDNLHILSPQVISRPHEGLHD
jgi:hypothetical protein